MVSVHCEVQIIIYLDELTYLDYGWTGWQPLPLDFCNNVLPKLINDGVQVSREIQNDCDPGDRLAISNATIEEGRFDPRTPMDSSCTDTH